MAFFLIRKPFLFVAIAFVHGFTTVGFCRVEIPARISCGGSAFAVSGLLREGG
jgi:hypothetical protein